MNSFQPKISTVLAQELHEQPRPKCDLENPKVLYERFGFKKESVCWIVIYKIPRLKGDSVDNANAYTASRCLSLPQIRNAYNGNIDAANEVDELEENVDALTRKVDINSKVDWTVLGLAILNAALTVIIVVIRQRLKRLAEIKKDEERRIIRQRMPAGNRLSGNQLTHGSTPTDYP